MALKFGLAKKRILSLLVKIIFIQIFFYKLFSILLSTEVKISINNLH
jgi:hypothetical protein